MGTQNGKFGALIALVLSVFIGFQIFLLASGNNAQNMLAFTATFSSASASLGSQASYGLNYDTAGYEKLLEYYQQINLNSLTAEQKQRFIKIGTGDRTGCGQCCGILNGPGIDSSGNPRCGCGHNLALVGLMKYLVKEHGDKFTDAQIFDEIVKWKKIFFPGQVADDGSVIGT